jgi:phospholipid-binding lipoprotein MlaA
MGRWITRCVTLLLAVSLMGCASTRNPHDPLEGFNRRMFQFNDAVDNVAVKPAAVIYRSMTPSFVQTGVGNFFGNLADVPTMVNNVLQGKFENGLTDFMRVALNTTMGLGGVLDIASEAGLQKHREDFGQTFGKWGVPSGPYVVMPIFGPSTMRDTAAMPLDWNADLWVRAHGPLRSTGAVLRLIDQRAALLDASTLIEEAALDRYEFVRDAYLQRRENHVYDGEIPVKKKYDPDAALKRLLPMEPNMPSVVELEHSAHDLAIQATLPNSTSGASSSPASAVSTMVSAPHGDNN